jgi:hypothetical protein
LFLKVYFYEIHGTDGQQFWEPVLSFITTPSQLHYSVVRFILNNRKQNIDLKWSNTNWSTVKHGVPYGSLLGRLLCHQYINNLHLQLSIWNLNLYSLLILVLYHNHFQKSSDSIFSKYRMC